MSAGYSPVFNESGRSAFHHAQTSGGAERRSSYGSSPRSRAAGTAEQLTFGSQKDHDEQAARPCSERPARFGFAPDSDYSKHYHRRAPRAVQMISF